jgi:hypothetical protein
MPVLTPQQRNTLESAVKQARKLAQIGAYNALKALAVDNPEPFAHMNPEQRSLRNRLRNKARLIGDELPASGNQQIDHLAYELAYENWHKMLFAKFLESNNLLMHTSGIAITMEECEELAKEESFIDKWDAAAMYASKMLPAIFRPEDPIMQVSLASDDRIKLEEVLDGLDNFTFIADDALGWVYQFWQTDEKKRINDGGDKIDGEKLPAVTQLFTEPYMVHFLIDNTLGAWWVSRNPGVKPPIKFEYLRLLEDGMPAAGKFEGWPDKISEVTALDPCMGSGHFVASLFPVFAALRMQEEGLTKEEATDKIIAENLHGLELDARCTQIAAFNLALTAWKFCGHFKELPEMNLACSGIAPKGKVEDWVKLVGNVKNTVEKARLENGMKMLYNHFQLAPELGSLLDPTTIKADAFTASFTELQPVLKRALENEADTEQIERGVMAAGIAKAGYLLANTYCLLITNPPFLGKGKYSDFFNKYADIKYKTSNKNLATIFVERLVGLQKSNGVITVIMPQDWLYSPSPSYKAFRKNIIENKKINFIVNLGAGAFEEISGEVVKVICTALTKTKPISDECFFYFDLSDIKKATEKTNSLSIFPIALSEQKKHLNNPDSRIILQDVSAFPLLEVIADGVHGLGTKDSFHFINYFWEINSNGEKWEFMQSATDNSKMYSGTQKIVLWEKGEGLLHERARKGLAVLAGAMAHNKPGVLISQVGNLKPCIYLGSLFEKSAAVISISNDMLLPAIWCFTNSKEYINSVKAIDKKIAVTNKTLVKVPFNAEYWQKVADDQYPNGLPKPYSDDSTQWLFHGHPVKTENPLQVALTRVLGYSWPAESDTNMELADEARALIEAVKAFDHLSDEDGIFCIPSVNAEQGGAERLRDYLQQVFAGEWNNQTITQLLQKEGAKSSNLEAWLRDEFFIQHCKLFQNRPFIWHIWDGRKDGFSAMVNYHKLDNANLYKLTHTYLGDWIRMCDAKRKSGESGADGLLSAAYKLKDKLEAILKGEAPYDIFVRWQPLEKQPIGWEPDLNDGVRLNIRPFVEAGVLRNKFNIKWGIDRGKNPPGAFWGEVRDNDKHLSLEEKREARKNNENIK